MNVNNSCFTPALIEKNGDIKKSVGAANHSIPTNNQPANTRNYNDQYSKEAYLHGGGKKTTPACC